MNTLELEKRGKQIRKEILGFKTRSGIGHLQSCLSCVDIMVSLYYDQETYFNHKNDMMLFSKAHGSPSVYPILADLGYFDKRELDKYCTREGVLRVHSDSTIPGCHFVGGSLGNGIGYAAGLAYAGNKNICVLLGDAELYEGSVWEALLFIAHHKLNHLQLIVDRNGLGILGATEELLKLEPIDEKLESFGFDVRIVDGHNYDELRSAFASKPEAPNVVIANTVKGKGVSYMENLWWYHSIIPKEKDLIEQGLKELS